MVYRSISDYSEYNNFGSWVLSGILAVLILILSLRYSNGTVDDSLFGLLLVVLVCSLISMFVRILKNNKSNTKIINMNNTKIEIANKESSVTNNIIETEQANDFERSIKNKKSLKKVRFDAPLKEYEIIDNYQKDFFTFRNTLYQNSSNDFDYADIMNQEHELMDSKKPMKGKLWDLYDDLTKPDYSKIPVRYDNNLNNASQYYPVSYKGPTVRLT